MSGNRITTRLARNRPRWRLLASTSAACAIVTGASSGIGVETARALASAGAEVTLAMGGIEAGRYDALGPVAKSEYFHTVAARNPAGRIGTVDDIAQAALFALSSTFLTGVTLPIDGGQPLT